MSDPQQPPVPPYAPAGDYPPTAAQPPAAQPYGSPPQGHAVPAQPYPGAFAPPTGARANGLGRAAFLVAVITLAVSLLMSLAIPFVYRAADFRPFVIEMYSGATGLISLVGCVIALILGLTALRRSASPLFAGIAIGIAGSSILGTVVSWISTLFYAFI